MWAVGALALALLAGLSRGILTQSWTTALLVIAVIGFLNALVRPTLVYFKLSPTVLTFGLATLLVNGSMLWLVGEFVPGFAVSGPWSVFLVALGMAAISLSFGDLLAIDDDDSYYHHVVRHIVELYGGAEETETPGVVFLEIDGLSEPVLRRAIHAGRMPTLARWLETGSHKLVQWECDLSSQTSASQAGILLGNNFDIPAFRWYEKDRGKQMVSNHPYDVIALEQRLSNGTGLLARNGASRSNLFSGDAPQTMFTASTLGDLSRHHTQDFYPLFMGVYTLSWNGERLGPNGGMTCSRVFIVEGFIRCCALRPPFSCAS
jgi:putative membrane protein